MIKYNLKLKEKPFEYEGSPQDLINFFDKQYNNYTFFYKIHKKVYNTFLYTSLENSYFIYQNYVKRKNKKYSHQQFEKIKKKLQRMDVVPPKNEKIAFYGGAVYSYSYDITDIKKEYKEILGFFCIVSEWYLYTPSLNKITYCKIQKHDSDINFPTIKKSDYNKANTLDINDLYLKKIFNEKINIKKYDYKFKTIKERIRNGDIYQAIISERIHLTASNIFDTNHFFSEVSKEYKNAYYSYSFKLPKVSVVGNCSLAHIIIKNGKMTTNVFAGTKPVKELEKLKEKIINNRLFSEHIMLVDLERNDFGKVAKVGSVKVEKLLDEIQIGSTIYISSKVTGKTKRKHDLSNLLFTSFPRGVVTGAPKIKAMEIINEIEESNRGFYSGIIGIYDTYDKSIVSNTIVTCAIISNNIVTIPVGSGIVYDADVYSEKEELFLKSKILLNTALRNGAA